MVRVHVPVGRVDSSTASMADTRTWLDGALISTLNVWWWGAAYQLSVARWRWQAAVTVFPGTACLSHTLQEDTLVSNCALEKADNQIQQQHPLLGSRAYRPTGDYCTGQL